MTGPSITGSEKGIPTSMASAPASAAAGTTSVQAAGAGGDVGEGRLRPGARRARRMVSIPSVLLRHPGRHAPAQGISATWATSLSPRPQRFTSTVEPDGRSTEPASRTTQATAWAGSRAGMMPSVRASREKASSTS